jgi:hypothetical protein
VQVKVPGKHPTLRIKVSWYKAGSKSPGKDFPWHNTECLDINQWHYRHSVYGCEAKRFRMTPCRTYEFNLYEHDGKVNYGDYGMSRATYSTYIRAVTIGHGHYNDYTNYNFNNLSNMSIIFGYDASSSKSTPSTVRTTDQQPSQTPPHSKASSSRRRSSGRRELVLAPTIRHHQARETKVLQITHGQRAWNTGWRRIPPPWARGARGGATGSAATAEDDEAFKIRF